MKLECSCQYFLFSFGYVWEADRVDWPWDAACRFGICKISSVILLSISAWMVDLINSLTRWWKHSSLRAVCMTLAGGACFSHISMWRCKVPWPWASTVPIYARTAPKTPGRHSSPFGVLRMLKTTSRSVLIMKWKDLADAKESEAMFVALCSAVGPAVASKWSKLMLAPAITWAIGSWSDGLIVIQRLGGPNTAVVLHDLDRMESLFSSVPMTLLRTARRCCRSTFTPSWLNGLPSSSSWLAWTKSAGVNDCISCRCWAKVAFWIWSNTDRQTCRFWYTPKTWNENCSCTLNLQDQAFSCTMLYDT